MMPSDAEIEQRFWKELKSTMTMMLGLDGVRDGQVQPMTAQIEGDEGGPLWFFTSKDNSLIEALGQGHRAIATFTSKGHDLFASVSGELSVTDNRADIERLWNAWVEPWFEGGKDDPKVALLRLDPDGAKIWLNGTGLGAAVSRLLGKDPKEDYQDKVAEVTL
jgi:general stress protein 26